ncbi:MAG: amidohydrolase family protein, partial [Nocardioidaceae bacterium]
MTEPVIITGGPIRQSLHESPSELPDALLVDGGRVVAVGSRTGLAGRYDHAVRVVDLEGRTLAPGFVDAHAHTLLHGSSLDWVDLSGARSIDDVVSALTARAGRDATGAIRGYGYDQSKLVERRHPAASDLDRVSTARPVQIQHASGHGYAVNSVVLADSGIT